MIRADGGSRKPSLTQILKEMSRQGTWRGHGYNYPYTNRKRTTNRRPWYPYGGGQAGPRQTV